ncbi:MAG: BatA domain-containing protein, partial [Planctomycetales bacterium]|nr:BatA domain-containing protein [Planctomycetales bacterium]
MTFLNTSLLFGGLLLAIPIVLHMIMRRQPKPMVFPAMRFLQARQQQSQRHLQLKHWLLLLTRCLVLLLPAIALARPSVLSSELGGWLMAFILFLVGTFVLTLGGLARWRQTNPTLAYGLVAGAALLLLGSAVTAWRASAAPGAALIGNSSEPIAAVLVIDCSPRMQYRHQNQTRLQDALDKAAWLLRQLPEGSDIAIVSSSSQGVAYSVDLSAATAALDRIAITAVPRTLPTLLEESLQLLQASVRERREVYVFTDRTVAAWHTSDAQDFNAA